MTVQIPRSLVGLYEAQKEVATLKIPRKLSSEEIRAAKKAQEELRLSVIKLIKKSETPSSFKRALNPLLINIAGKQSE